MLPSSVCYYRCPLTGSELLLADAVSKGGDVVAGKLVAANGCHYSIESGIPHFVSPEMLTAAESQMRVQYDDVAEGIYDAAIDWQFQSFYEDEDAVRDSLIDMLFLQPGTSTLVRAQGTFTADEEISRVVEFLECDPCFAPELVQLTPGGSKEGKGGFLEMLRARDDVYEAAIDVVVREGRGSVSLLQRALGIGYGRAARLVDFMAEDGIVGNYNGSQARDVLYTPEQWDQVKQTGQIPKAG